MSKMDVRRKQVEFFSAALAVLILWIFGERVGEYGIAYLTGALLCMAALWTMIGVHLAEALGKMLRSRNARGQYRNAAGSRRNIMTLQGAFGLLGSLALLFLAAPIAQGLIGMAECTLIIRVLAPYLFLHTIASVLKGYLLGARAELPVCIGSLLRQALILFFGLLLEGRFHAYGDMVSALLGPRKFSYMYGVVGICIGFSLAELVEILFLFVMYQRFGKMSYKQEAEGRRITESFGTHLRVAYGYRWPALLMRALELLPFFAGTCLFMQKQTDKNTAVVNLGGFFGGYLAQCGFIVLLSAGLLLPVCTRIVSLMRKEEQRYARSCFLGGLHAGIVHALFWSVLLMVLAEQAGELLPLGGQLTGRLLAQGAALILPAVLCFYFFRLLTGFGGQYLVAGIKVVGAIVFVAVFLILSGNGQGIQAMVPGLLISAVIECLLSGFLVFRQLRAGADLLLCGVAPTGAVCGVGLLCLLLKKLLMPHLGAMVTMAICVVCGGFVYWSLLILLRNFKEEELEIIPGGKIIRAMGEMLHIYKV
ncbi:MAG: hypothetical protein NC081_05620 [Roseburia sp.]|nr:hypothetical protein [Roseburia sp.]